VTEPSPDGDRLSAVFGSPGGSTIPTTGFQVLSNTVDFGMGLAAAVDAPRVHHQCVPDHLRVEPGALRPDVVDELIALGHEVIEAAEPWGDVQAIRAIPARAGSDRVALEGVSDWRRGGTALGI
jgi:gamma-glutamyltranspeptidase/glutathione hydrolase